MAASGKVPIVHPVINWSDWTPLFPTKELDAIPQEPGIYLVSHEALSGIQYVGHSGPIYGTVSAAWGTR